MRNPRVRFDIEALRVFGVLAFMLFSTGLAGAGHGYLGIDIWFVVTGYLIIGSLHREYLRDGRILLLDFWSRRARAVLPTAATVLVTVAVITSFVVDRLPLIELRFDLVWAALFGANIRFGLAGFNYFDATQFSPVYNFWALSMIEQFFIAAPIVILFIHLIFFRIPMSAIPRVMQIVLFVITVASGLSFMNQGLNSGWEQFSFGNRIWEFTLGGLVALWPSWRTVTRSAALPILKALVWAFLVYLVFRNSTTGAFSTQLISQGVIAAALLLWLGAESKTAGELDSEGLLTPFHRLLGWLGGISFAAYLWFWPIAWLIGFTASNQTKLTKLPPLQLVGALVLAVVAAELTNRLIANRYRPGTRASKSNQLTFRMTFRNIGLTVGLIGITALLPFTAVVTTGNTGDTAKAEINPIWLATDPNWLDRVIKAEVPKINFNAKIVDAVPDITMVRDDIPEINDNGCHADRTTPEPTARCTYGNPKAKRTIVLFGDSHAAQYFGGLDAATKARGYRFLPRTRASCPAADVSGYIPNTRGRYTICDDWRRSVLKELRHSKPDLVIISNQRPYNLYDRKTGNLVTNQDEVAALWESGYARTIRVLTEVGIKVMVLRDVPRWPFDVPNCLATTNDPKQCTMATGVGLDPTSDSIDIANRMPGAVGVDLTSAICGKDTCFPIRGGIILARDDAHLTRSYSVALTTLWQALIVHELERNQA